MKVKTFFLTFLFFFTIVKINAQEVVVHPNRINVNNTSLSTPGLSIIGSNYGNSIGLSNGTQEWRMTTWTDNTFKLVKLTGSTFTPFTVHNNSFQDAIVIAQNGVGFGTNDPDYKFDFQGSVGVNTAVGSFHLIHKGTGDGHRFSSIGGGQYLQLSALGTGNSTYVRFDGHDGRLGVGPSIIPETTLHVYDGNLDALNVGDRTGSGWGYMNVQKPTGNGSRIAKWRDGTLTTIDIEGQSATYQLTIYGSALASGGSWVPSDENLKSGIRNTGNSLEKIMQLEPKMYEYKSKEFSFLNLPKGNQYGFLAQDLKKVVPELVKESKIQNTDSESVEEYDLHTVNYDGLIPILTGAIKEQQEIIEQQKSLILANSQQIEQQKSEMEELKNLVYSFTNSKGENIQTAVVETARLGQNMPNPSDDATRIPFFIPSKSQKASINIYNINGQLLKTISINSFGEGFIELQTGELSNGYYTYTLEVDNRLVDTKKMNIIK